MYSSLISQRLREKDLLGLASTEVQRLSINRALDEAAPGYTPNFLILAHGGAHLA
jgi:hypothetical protein